MNKLKPLNSLAKLYELTFKLLLLEVVVTPN